MNSNRTWIEIDADAFDQIVSHYKRLIGTRDLALVIKANAYGHGMQAIAQLAQENENVSWLCVATISEALEIRRSGCHKPILVIATIDQDPITIINQNIHCAVFDRTTLERLNQIGNAYNYRFPIHLKIDTGLSRLGVKAENALELIAYIQTLKYIELAGIYSHFAESNNPDQTFTLEQIDRFKQLLAALQGNAITIKHIHLANSAGTMLFDLPFCNLFRVGCGMYGLWPGASMQKRTQKIYPWFKLQPIITWKTHIAHINVIESGQSIGYDRTYTAERDMRIHNSHWLL